MRKIFATFVITSITILMCVMGAQPPTNPSVSLAWDPSTDPDVTNYNLYYGLAHSNYTVGPIPMGNVTNFILEGAENPSAFSGWDECDPLKIK